MNANIIECVQGDSTWLNCRIGCVTSSRVADVVAVLKRASGDRKKGDPTAGWGNLVWELVCEILTQKASEHYVSRWMEEGKEKEPLARAAYEIIQGVDTRQIGFAFHPRIKMAGASPDALVGSTGGAEFKCPKTSTHLKYLMGGVVPEEYKPQMYWQMACLDWEWCDFASHDPDLKKSYHRTFIAPRLYRDEKLIGEMECKVEQLNAEVQETILKLDPDYVAERLTSSLEVDPELQITEEDVA